KHIKDLCGRGLPPSRPMIRKYAAQIAQKTVGKNWVSRFVARTHIDFISHWAPALHRQRFRAD
ncbi:hypothetical protein IQ07DRAFT_480045, partial [Pyrenochaeta sp. DS3sAY3a]